MAAWKCLGKGTLDISPTHMDPPSWMQDAESLHCKISIICLVLAKRSDMNSVNPVLGAQCGAESGKWASTWRAGIFSKAVTWLAIGHFWSQIPHRCPAWCSHPAFNTSSEPGWVLRMDQAQSNWNTNKIKTFTYVEIKTTDLLICCICSIFSPSVSKKKCCKWILWQLGCPTAGVAGGIQMLCLAKLQQWGRVEVLDPRSSSEKEQDCRHINGKKYWTICHYPDPYISACQFVSNNILEHMQRSVTVCGTRVSSQKCLSNVPLQWCRMKICCDNFCMFLPSQKKRKEFSLHTQGRRKLKLVHRPFRITLI